MGMGMGFGGGGSGRMGWSSRTELRELAKGSRFDWAILRRALGSFAAYKWQSIVIIVSLFATAGLGTLPPLFTRSIVNDGILGRHFGVVLHLTFAVLAVAIVSGLLSVLQNYLSSVIGQRVMADYRYRLFEHLHRQSQRFFVEAKSGELVSRVMNDVGAIQTVATSTIMSVVSNVLTIGTTLTVMFILDWKLSLLSLVIVPFFVAPTQKVGSIRQDMQRDIQQYMARMTTQLAETLGISGSMAVKAFARERYEMERFSTVNNRLRDLTVRQSLVGRWFFMWVGLFSSIGPALLYAYGGWLYIHHRISLGTIIAFVAYLGRLYSPLSSLAQLQVTVLTSVALFRRIYSLLDHPPEIQDGPSTIDAARGTVTFEDVWFSYNDTGEPALRGLNIEIPAGKVTALVGPSGAGKTTILHMVARFYDPTSGVVCIDGHDLRTLTLESLRNQIGLVPQEPFLFNDTVLANLLYARLDATREEVEDACRAAQIHELLAGLPDGYETLVGERGYRMSGGEKQRLAIARVLLRHPRVVLLDEATSSLDTLAERRVQEALQRLLQGRTALVIAHRLSTVLSAHQILVIDHGQVVARGTHSELLAQGGLYAQLYAEQFGGGEDPSPPERRRTRQGMDETERTENA